MFGLSQKITGIIGGAMAFALVFTAVWATRVNHLRAEHKETVDAVVHELETAGFKPVTKSRIAADVQYLATAARTNRKSLDDATKEIGRLNGEADARAKAYADAKARDASTIAKLDALAKGSDRRIQILEGIRQHAEAAGDCPVAAGLIEQAEGL
ncbi:hypothetical protein DFR49_3345 [Hephaestia caeni]|uniref:Bacteriophage Rz lysis protein n=1 Tax=Hephaestia caeni TaxID=645617 RepID=A0A397NIX7_9SPHN|nr:hypothetical protein [Hephaestia caeni]RIA37460.1 hypothetical protein DFR49_3345 [Hephaestia caeni]